MDERLVKILHKLKDYYPYYELNFKTKPTNKSTILLTADDNRVYEFNPDIILKDVEFLKDNENYDNFILQLFLDPLKTYHKKNNPNRVKAGRKSKGLSLQEIQAAINNTNSNSAAARYCNVSYNTYKKYSKLYNKWEENLNTRGVGMKSAKHYIKISGKRYTKQDLIDGNIPITYSNSNLKQKIINMSLLKEECSVCGFHEKRITDGKIPLMIDYIDGYSDNRKLENIRFLCFNCYYLYVGTFWYRKKGLQKNNIQIENEFKLMQSREKKQNNYVDVQPIMDENIKDIESNLPKSGASIKVLNYKIKD